MSTTSIQSLSDQEDGGSLPSFEVSFYSNISESAKPVKVQETPLDYTYMNIHNTYTPLETATPTNTGNQTYMHLERVAPTMQSTDSAKDIFYEYCVKKENDLTSWKSIDPGSWHSGNVMDFIYYIEEKHDLSTHIRGENFQGVNGCQLCGMPLDELQRRDPQFGNFIFNELQQIKNEGSKYFQNDPLDLSSRHSSFLEELQEQEIDNDEYLKPLLSSPIPIGIDQYDMSYNTQDYNNNDGGLLDYVFDPQDKFPDIDHGYESSVSRSSDDSAYASIDIPGVPVPVLEEDDDINNNSTMDHTVMSVQTTTSMSLPGQMTIPKPDFERRGPGRPRRPRSDGSFSSTDDITEVKGKTRGRKPGQMSKAGNHLWEFIRDLLKDPSYNPHLIKWEDAEEGVFRIVKSSEVSKLWGRKKNNSLMNYEKLSRAMRHYYKTGILQAVLGRRLVYQFGSKATEWKPAKN